MIVSPDVEPDPDREVPLRHATEAVMMKLATGQLHQRGRFGRTATPFSNSQALAISINLGRAIRPKQPDGIQPLVKILPEPPRASVLGGADLCAQAKGPEKRDDLFAFRDEAAIGQPHE